MHIHIFINTSVYMSVYIPINFVLFGERTTTTRHVVEGITMCPSMNDRFRSMKC